MRVLFVHQTFASQKEVGSGRANDFARCCAEGGHEVVVLTGTFDYLTGQVLPNCRGKLHVRETVDGYEVVRTWTYDGYHRSYLHRVLSFLTFMGSALIRGLGFKRFDVVVACSPPFFVGITGYLLALWHRAVFIYEVRDLWSDVAFQLGIVRNRWIAGLVRRIERLLYRGAAVVVVNSPGFVAPLAGAGVARERIALVPNGIDLELFRPLPEARERVRAEYGLDGKFVVLYAGSHGMANSLDSVLDAAQLLGGERGIVFLLVGDGKEKRRLTQRAAVLDLTNVRFLGPHPKQRIPELVAAADAGVAALLDVPLLRTTYPNKVLDYMACGKPTLLAIDGVIREVIEEADAGVFVAPGDASALAEAVRGLLANPERCRAMGARGRAYVEAHCDRRVMMLRMRELLERAVGDRRSRAAANTAARPW